MQVTILGSGSAGNCTLIKTDSTAVLVDAGLSGRQISQRLESIGRTATKLDGVILTHEHSDHTRGLAVLCKDRCLAVYANRLTAEAFSSDPQISGRAKISWRLFSTGTPFNVGDLMIESFSVPHDAYDPVGFTIRNGAQSIAVLTDLGHATKLVIERVRHVDVLVIESNHDVKLLQEDVARPWALKQRIMSRHGHLSNDAAASVTTEIAGERLRHVLLAHLSRDCNRPDLARQVVLDQLRRIGANHVAIAVASQDKPTATLTV
jgi:phosphoribosyl 1,2-cyclic phosphodiesterase